MSVLPTGSLVRTVQSQAGQAQTVLAGDTTILLCRRGENLRHCASAADVCNSNINNIQYIHHTYMYGRYFAIFSYVDVPLELDDW